MVLKLTLFCLEMMFCKQIWNPLFRVCCKLNKNLTSGKWNFLCTTFSPHLCSHPHLWIQGDECMFHKVKPKPIKNCRVCRKPVMWEQTKITFAWGQGRGSSPQRIGFCYNIQLKIISCLDLIFQRVVIVHANLFKRHHCIFFRSPKPTAWAWFLFPFSLPLYYHALFFRKYLQIWNTHRFHNVLNFMLGTVSSSM